MLLYGSLLTAHSVFTIQQDFDRIAFVLPLFITCVSGSFGSFNISAPSQLAPCEITP
jgi:hypothetical protein